MIVVSGGLLESDILSNIRVVDLSSFPVELVAKHEPTMRLSQARPNLFQIEHPDLWFDGRWVER